MHAQDRRDQGDEREHVVLVLELDQPVAPPQRRAVAARSKALDPGLRQRHHGAMRVAARVVITCHNKAWRTSSASWMFRLASAVARRVTRLGGIFFW